MAKFFDMNAEGIQEVIKDFRDMAKRCGQPKRAMDVVAAKGWKNVILHFDAEEGPDGPWTPLKSKSRSGFGILKDTGRLRGSNMFRSVDDEAHVYNRVKYARIHNSGGTVKRAVGSGYITINIPQRKFMWVDEKTRTSMASTLLKYITRGEAI